MHQLFLITNPGSSSRKYSIYEDGNILANLHFEYENGAIICTFSQAGKKQKLDINLDSLSTAPQLIPKILTEAKIINDERHLDAIIARIVAPTDYFTDAHIVDEEFIAKLDHLKRYIPIHGEMFLSEIKLLRDCFAGVRIVAVSDSHFHKTRPELMHYYAINKDIADRYGIKRYGYHGFSCEFISRYMRQENILAPKTVVAHLGGGASVTALQNGLSHDTSMGFSPLEGLCMAARAGDIDVLAALAIKRELNFKNDADLAFYINRQCGLLGLSGLSDDMREILAASKAGNQRATLARDMFAYRAQTNIAKMAASMAGIDALVFTATIGERSDPIRKLIVEKMAYLGFELDQDKNQNPTFTKRHALISTPSSKPVYIVKTDEAAIAIRNAEELLAS